MDQREVGGLGDLALGGGHQQVGLLGDGRPFALGMRLRDRPEGAREYRVESGAQAIGMTVAELHEQQDVWVTLVVRDSAPVPLGAQTVFQAGDEVLLLVEPTAEPGAAFAAR